MTFTVPLGLTVAILVMTPAFWLVSVGEALFLDHSGECHKHSLMVNTLINCM